jgi:tRNA pseudouridine32 synthase/23S rRNA pseudouridine746 synthase
LKHFQHFKTDISGIALPKKFTFPFYYEPHILAKIATTELQAYLENQTDFEHNFGLQNTSDTALAIGKMFGVLVVRNEQNKLGYLTAFSGKLADKSLPEQFVPPVFNMRTSGSFYIKGELEIDEMNAQLGVLKKDKKYLELKKIIAENTAIIQTDLSFQRNRMKLAKRSRKQKKKAANGL